MAFVHLYVKAPAGNGYTTPQAMKRVDDHLTLSFLAMMHCPPPSGLPVQETDGTWQVRVLDPTMVPIVKRVLQGHYGLEIVREERVE